MTHELEIIAAIRKRAHKNVGGLRLGIGDDAAVVQPGGGRDFLVCCDLSIEGVHFRRDWMSPKLIGRKALAVTLSDIAAMGGTARFALISIAMASNCSAQMIDEMFTGLVELANKSGVAIIGGDTSSSPQGLFIDAIAIGECEAGKAITRGGARPGELIFVSGSLGASGLGLKFLERGHQLQEVGSPAIENAEDALIQSAIRKHLIPEPRLRFGQALGDHHLATAMIDLSDGLSTDLHHLLEESHCGAVIQAESVPVADVVSALSLKAFQIEPLAMVLQSGEEYELLFTAHRDNQEKIVALAAELGTPVTAIGEIIREDGVKLLRDSKVEIIQPSGYEHKI
jgi:thiamine-monophosphate kinase